MSDILIAIYISLIVPAFLFSLAFPGKKHPKYLIIFAVILGSDLVIEVWANYLPLPFHLKRNGLYNIAMLIEFWGYGFYYLHVLRNKIIHRIIKLYLVILPLVWIALVYLLSGFNIWNSSLSVIGSIAMIILSACMYYQLFTTTPLVKLTGSFEFWIATGLIIFFACNFTYLGILNSLTDLYRLLSHSLLTILQISNCAFYCIITYAFFCLYRNNRKENKSQPVITSRTLTGDPNNYGLKFLYTDVKGGLTIDASTDDLPGHVGYLVLTRSFFSAMKTHTDTVNAANNLATISNTIKLLTIVGHGRDGILGTGIGNVFNGGPCSDKCMSQDNETRWKQLFSGLSTKGIVNLYLLSCNTGAEEEGAQLLFDLANTINATVVAPTGRILLNPTTGFFELQDKSEWQVARPGQPKPNAIPKPRIVIPPFTNYILVYDTKQGFRVSFNQITQIFITRPDNWDKETELPHNKVVKFLGSANFTKWEDLKGGVMAGFITGAFTVQFNYEPANDLIAEQRKRKYFIRNNLFIQDSEYPDIVYHCKESIGRFFT